MLVVFVGCSKGPVRDSANEERLAQLRSEPAVSLLVAGSKVVDRGELRPCQKGSRSDDWGEVVVVFETDRPFAEVADFYRAELARLEWEQISTSAYASETLVFRSRHPENHTQIRLSAIGSERRRYMLVAETPPARKC